MGIAAKQNYRHWLRTSETWQTARLMCLGWQQMMCQGCGKVSEHNDAHHILYAKTWEQTRMWQLRVLCRACHKEIHTLTDPRQYGQQRQVAIRKFTIAANKIRQRHGLQPLLLKRHIPIDFDEINERKARREAAIKRVKKRHGARFKALRLAGLLKPCRNAPAG